MPACSSTRKNTRTARKATKGRISMLSFYNTTTNAVKKVNESIRRGQINPRDIYRIYKHKGCCKECSNVVHYFFGCIPLTEECIGVLFRAIVSSVTAKLIVDGRLWVYETQYYAYNNIAVPFLLKLYGPHLASAISWHTGCPLPEENIRALSDLPPRHLLLDSGSKEISDDDKKTRPMVWVVSQRKSLPPASDLHPDSIVIYTNNGPPRRSDHARELGYDPEHSAECVMTSAVHTDSACPSAAETDGACPSATRVIFSAVVLHILSKDSTI